MSGGIRKVLYLQYMDPGYYPPLENSSYILAGRGWDVLFLSSAVFGAIRTPLEGSCKNRKMFIIPACPPGPAQKLHYVFFCVLAYVFVLIWRPDWVYASDFLICPSLLIIKTIPGIKIAYHEHDSPARSEKTSMVMKFLLWTRKKAGVMADICILPNIGRAGSFAEQIKIDKKIICVWNCPRKGEIGGARAPKREGPLILYYHGSLGPQRFPESIVKTAAALKGRVEIRFSGYETRGSLGWVKHITREARKEHVEDFIKYFGAAPRYKLWVTASKCDIGLSAFLSEERNDVDFLVGASNKAFDYLACGLALLVPDSEKWKAMYVDPGYGLSCNLHDIESSVRCLEWFIGHPAEMRRMGEAGRQRLISEWNYEKQFEPVMNIIGMNE